MDIPRTSLMYYIGYTPKSLDGLCVSHSIFVIDSSRTKRFGLERGPENGSFYKSKKMWGDSVLNEDLYYPIYLFLPPPLPSPRPSPRNPRNRSVWTVIRERSLEVLRIIVNGSLVSTPPEDDGRSLVGLTLRISWQTTVNRPKIGRRRSSLRQENVSQCVCDWV